MTNNAEPESTRPAVVEQRLNRVETGSGLAQLAEFVETASREWKESGTLPFLLLRALCRLTRRFPERSAEGFTPIDLQQAITAEKRGWCEANDKEAIARSVRKVWNDLDEKFPRKLDHLITAAIDRRLTLRPKLDRREGGGTGNPTRYLLMAEPLDAPVPTPRADSRPHGDINYICEDVEPAGGLLRAFTNGFEPRGWRRWAYASGAFALFALIAIVGLVGFLALFVEGAIGRALAVMLSVGFIIFTIWRVLAPLYRPLFVRIAAMPGWLQSDDQDRLLEFRKPPRHERKALYAVRYRGTCPLCGGAVLVKQRGLLDFADLAGFCEEAPKVHVFSFDHVLRVGRRLQS